MKECKVTVFDLLAFGVQLGLPFLLVGVEAMQLISPLLDGPAEWPGLGCWPLFIYFFDAGLCCVLATHGKCWDTGQGGKEECTLP